MERLNHITEKEAREAREAKSALEDALAAASAMLQQRDDEIVLLQADCSNKLAAYFDNLEELAKLSKVKEDLVEQVRSHDEATAAQQAQGEVMAAKLRRALGAARAADACMEDSHATVSKRLREQAHRVLQAERALAKLKESGISLGSTENLPNQTGTTSSLACNRDRSFKPDTCDAGVSTDIRHFTEREVQAQVELCATGSDPLFQNWQSAATNTDKVPTADFGSEIDDELRHNQEQHDRVLEEQGDGVAAPAAPERDPELEAEMEELRLKLKEKSNLLHLGEVRIENFDRMKGRGFGPDPLVRLSYIEYCLNYDQDGGEEEHEGEEEVAVREAQRKRLRVQLQSLRVEKELILQQLVRECSMHELAQFKTATERAILQISSFNVLTSLEHFKSGGVYLDVLKVHRIVVDKVINKAGGWGHAMRVVQREASGQEIAQEGAAAPHMHATEHWPDFFRIKVLEFYRERLAATMGQMSEHISFGASERQALIAAHAAQREQLGAERASLAAEVEALKERKRGGARFGIRAEAAKIAAPEAEPTTAPDDTPAQRAPSASPAPAAASVAAEAPPAVARSGKARLSSVVGVMSVKAAESDTAKALAAKEAECREAAGRAQELEARLCAAEEAASAAAIFRRLHASADELLFRALYHMEGDSAESDAISCYIEGLLDALASWREGYFADTENALNMCAEIISEHNDMVFEDDDLNAHLLEDKQISLGIVQDLRLLLEGLHLEFGGEVGQVHHKLEQFVEFRERLADDRAARGGPAATAEVGTFTEEGESVAGVDAVAAAAAVDEGGAESFRVVTCSETQTTARGELAPEIFIRELASAETQTSAGADPQSMRLQLPHFLSLSSGLLELTDRDDPSPCALSPSPLAVACAATVTEEVELDQGAGVAPLATIAALAPAPLQGRPRRTLLATRKIASIILAPSPVTPTAALARISEEAAIESERALNIKSKRALKGAAKGVGAELALMRASRKKQAADSEKRLRDAEESFQRELGDAVQNELLKMVKEVSNAHMQTDPEGEVELLRLQQQEEMLALQQAQRAELAVSDPHYNPHALPPGFLLVHVANRQLELCPGVFLVTYHEHRVRPSKLPRNVVYCHREESAAYSRDIHQLPQYVPVPRVAHCEAVVLPTVLELPYHCGVQLIYGSVLGSPSCVELPSDIFVVKMSGDGAILPPGLTVVSLSGIVKIPDTVCVPAHLDAVQLLSQVVLPAGVEIADGCTVAAAPDGMTLPSNVLLIERRCGARIPPFMTPLVATGEVDVEVKVVEAARDGVTIVRRPAEIALNVGVEAISRPKGHSIPPGMIPLPASQHPPHLRLRGDLELVQLAPRFDFPAGCSPAPGWSFYPRPPGLRLPLGTHLLRCEEERGIGGALPPFLCAVPVPSHSYGVKLPPSVIAVEFLGGVEQPLPEGTVIAPGIKVLSFGSIFPGGDVDPSARSKIPCNAVIAERLPGSALPRGVERGTRTDLPWGTLLPASVEVLLLSVRFEVPLGVKVDPNVVLGHGVQLPPGARLHPHVEVMEWPAFTFLQPGTELVKLQAGRSLPEGLQEVLVPRREAQQYGLDQLAGGDCKVVRLPHHLSTLLSAVELSEGVHVASKEQLAAHFNGTAAKGDEINATSVALPAGVALVRRETLQSLLPAGMATLGRAELPHALAQQLSRKVIEVSGSANPTVPIEAVKLPAAYSYAPGAELFPGVFVLPRPHWLNLAGGPLWLELVVVTAISPAVAGQLDALIVRLRPDTMEHPVSLPDGCVVVNLPPGGLPSVHRWGAGAKGVESVLLPKGLHLPPAHYVVRRMIKHHLPPCYKMGFSKEYEKMAVKLTLPPSLEVMHVVPTYHFPAGVTVLDTATLRADYTEPRLQRLLAGSCLQLAFGERLGEGVTYVPFPPLWSSLSDSFIADGDAEKWIFVAAGAGCALPRGFTVHERSAEAVSLLFANNFRVEASPRGGLSSFIDPSLYASNFCGLPAGSASSAGDAEDVVAVTEAVKLVSLPAGLPHFRVRAMHREELLIRELRADAEAAAVEAEGAAARTHRHTYSALEYDSIVRGAGDESGSNLAHLTADVMDNVIVVHPRMVSGLNPGDVCLDEMTEAEKRDLRSSEALITLSVEHERRKAARPHGAEGAADTDEGAAAAPTSADGALAGEDPPPISTKVLFLALEKAQTEISALQEENNNYRLGMTAAMREREQLNVVIARHEETIAGEREEYRLCREQVANVKMELTKAETMVKLKHNDWITVRGTSENQRSRLQGQINSLHREVALWQDASSDSTAVRQLMDDTLAARERQAEERLARREAAMKRRGEELLRVVVQQLAGLAEEVVASAHRRACEALRNASAFKGRSGFHLAPLQAAAHSAGDASGLSRSNNCLDNDSVSIGGMSADTFEDSLSDGAAEVANNSSEEEDSDRRGGGGLDDDVSMLSDDGTVNTLRSAEQIAEASAATSGKRAAGRRLGTNVNAAADVDFMPITSHIRLASLPPSRRQSSSRNKQPARPALPEVADTTRPSRARVIGELTKSNVHLVDGVNSAADSVDITDGAAGRVMAFSYDRQGQQQTLRGLLDTCADILGSCSDVESSDLAERVQGCSAQLQAWASGVLQSTTEFSDRESNNYLRALHLTEVELEGLAQSSRTQQRKIKLLRDKIVSLSPAELTRGGAPARHNPLEDIARVDRIAELERELRQARKLALGSVRSNLAAFASKFCTLQHLERQLKYFYFLHKKLSLEEEKALKRLQLKPDSDKEQRAVRFYAGLLSAKADNYKLRADVARRDIEAHFDAVQRWMCDYECALASVLPRKLINNILRRAGSDSVATDITNDNIGAARVPGGLGAALLSPIGRGREHLLPERRPSLSSISSEISGANMSLASHSSLLSANSLRSFASTVRSGQTAVSTAHSLPGNFFSSKLNPHFGAPGSMPAAQNIHSLTQFNSDTGITSRETKRKKKVLF